MVTDEESRTFCEYSSKKQYNQIVYLDTLTDYTVSTFSSLRLPPHKSRPHRTPRAWSTTQEFFDIILSQNPPLARGVYVVARKLNEYMYPQVEILEKIITVEVHAEAWG
jgi:hypothetical protein